MIKVRFKQWDCIALFKKYHFGNGTAIELVEEKTGEPIATASVNIWTEGIIDNQIGIKDYSENEGMVIALKKAGIIGELLYNVKRGYEEIGIYELLKTE